MYKNGVQVMEIRNREKRILTNALKALRKETNLATNVQPYVEPGLQGPDAFIQFTWQNMEWHFAIVVKPRLTRAMIGGVIQELRILPQKGLIITRYVTPQVADLLREMDIPFIDTVGNVYINELPLYIFIKGNKRADKEHAEPITRAFRPAGLQIIFALLCNPGLEGEPFRKIAKVATVALGTVTWVINDLKQMGYLIDVGKEGRRLIRKKNLLDRWVTAFPEQLRPKQLMGRYTADNLYWWENTNLAEYQAYWGGEIGAAILTRYLKPQIVTIYAHKPVSKLRIKNKMKKDPQGEIEILKAFWEFKYNWAYPDLVHPLLIYADLLTTGDARNIETAKIIYERNLDRFVRED